MDGEFNVTVGLTKIYSNTQKETSLVSLEEVSRHANHELGHKQGLCHPWEECATSEINIFNKRPSMFNEEQIQKIKSNFMNSDGYPGPFQRFRVSGGKPTIEDGQRKEMLRNIIDNFKNQNVDDIIKK
jgi:hypothetical protein